MHRRNSGYFNPTIHLISAVFVDSPLKLIGAMISIEGEYNLRPGATLKIISGAHRPYFEHEIVVLGNKISRITYFKWLRGFFPRVFSIARQQRRAKRVPRTPPFCTELCCEFSLSRQFFDGWVVAIHHPGMGSWVEEGPLRAWKDLTHRSPHRRLMGDVQN